MAEQDLGLVVGSQIYIGSALPDVETGPQREGDIFINSTDAKFYKFVLTYDENNNVTDKEWVFQDTLYSKVVVDSVLSDSSENPVQNKVIKLALDDINTQIGNIETLLDEINGEEA